MMDAKDSVFSVICPCCEATFELQKKKHDEAEEKFKKALDHPGEKE
jgi:uncharacterized Zn finger protein (UPF0148 family)